MAVAPLLIGAYGKFLAPCFAEASKKPERAPDEIDEKDNPVIVAGFGRFGQTTTRLLRACGIKATVLDFDAEQVEVLRRFGLKSFYGDASRMDLLRAAGIERAKVFIIAIDDKEKTTEIAKALRKEFPHLKILARCYDRIHAFEDLLPAGVDRIYIETSGSAIKLGRDALMMLGYSAKRALRAAQIFERSNDRSITHMAKIYHEVDDNEYIVHSNRWVDELERMLQADVGDGPVNDDRSWEAAPRADA
jgi:voltage-gated potassium channel Kch